MTFLLYLISPTKKADTCVSTFWGTVQKVSTFCGTVQCSGIGIYRPRLAPKWARLAWKDGFRTFYGNLLDNL